MAKAIRSPEVVRAFRAVERLNHGPDGWAAAGPEGIWWWKDGSLAAELDRLYREWAARSRPAIEGRSRRRNWISCPPRHASPRAVSRDSVGRTVPGLRSLPAYEL
jgi:hypothetical protein